MIKTAALLVLFTFYVVGCSEVAQEASVTIELPAAFAAQSQVSKIVLQVTAPDISTPITAELTPPFPEPPTFDVTIPPGTGRLFEVFGVLAGDPKSGFHGEATSDVTATGATVPITMNFINFAEDATGIGDAILTNPNNPDIESIHFIQAPDPCGIIITGAFRLTIDLQDTFVAPVDPLLFLRVLIEFDIDENAVTGTSPSKIEKESGVVEANFDGTDSYLEVRANLFTTTIQLLDSLMDMPINPPTAPPHFDAIFDPADPLKILTVCIDSAAFQSAIDTDADSSVGSMNVLVGIIDLGTLIFNPNDIAFRGGSIVYDFTFDTSSL